MSRILLVFQPTDGGVGRHVGDLAAGLIGAGHQVVLCGPALPANAPPGATHRRLRLQRAVRPSADLAAAAALAQAVRETRPDLVHAHSSKAGALARIARLAHPRVPVLYTPHGYAFAGYFERSAERRAYRAAERLLAPAATRVLCVCEAEARLARAIGPAGRVRVVHNGVPPALPAGSGPVDARIEELAAHGPVIGALTLLRPGKGVQTLIDATPDVVARNPDAQVAIVGDGPDLAALRERARHRGVERAVHFLGPRERPLDAFRGMRLLVHPSWAEALPYTILEAMSVGLPIVASDVGGVGEALVDGVSGALVPPRDAGALARAVNGLLERPQEMARIGAAARARAEREFSLHTMVERTAAIYAEAAGPMQR